MSELRTGLFNLAFRVPVKAKVLAYSSQGWSVESLENPTGPTIQVEPFKMDPPTEGILTNDTNIDLQWIPLVPPDNGDSSITSYIIYWDQGNTTNSYIELIGETTPYLGSSY